MRQVLSYLRAGAGDLDGAIAEARLAIEFATDKHLVLWRTSYQVEFAELLARRDADTDVEEARRVAAEALIEGEARGMVGWVTRGRKLLDQIK